MDANFQRRFAIRTTSVTSAPTGTIHFVATGDLVCRDFRRRAQCPVVAKRWLVKTACSLAYFLKQEAPKTLLTPLATLNRARHLLDCSSFSCPRLARKYSVADGIEPCVTRLEGARRADVRCTNFSFAFNTLSCCIVCRGITPRPLRCVLRPRAPAAHLSSIELPHLVNPTQHRCEFRLRIRQLLAQSK
jgi:hypothetical protein